MDSILTSIKKLLGIEKEYDHFDPDIIMHINSTFMTLTQLGVGPAEGFVIEDDTSAWNDFIDNPVISLEAVRSYTYLKVKLLFDPPLSSAVIEAMNRQISEYEWRINVAVENGKSSDDEASNENGTVVYNMDYTKLTNLPTFNGKPIVGNVNEEDPTVKPMPASDIVSLWNEKFDD